ncbi:MAG: condensation domain-containing protein, partial [Acidobacteriota bacterium]
QSRGRAGVLQNIDREQISVVNLPVSYWHEWVSELKAGRLSLPGTVRLVVAGGEGPLPERLDAWIGAVGSSTRMINAYGPTETTVDCVMWDAPDPSARPLRRVSIGRPIANARAWVVDHDLRRVPPGVPGELVICGDGVSHGYLQRPARTAETFLPDPFSSTPGTRLYRTGDRARVLADDTIECLGRIDFQVKIRGFRVETGEIESALLDDPRVIEAAVMAKEVSPGDRRLVAWVTPVSATTSGLDEALRQALRERLPGYMVPARIVVMPGGLPTTTADKVDRRALPDPDWVDSTTSSQPPRTPTEAIVADVFHDVLDCRGVGIHEDFFALGGHSLLAMRLLSRLRSVLEIDLPLQAVFEAPTIADLARRIDDARHTPCDGTALPPIAAIERTEGARLPLSFAQQRMWFLAQLEPESPAYNMPNALRFEGPFDLDILGAALGELHARHESLRTTFDAERGVPDARVESVEAFRKTRTIDLAVEAANDLDAALRLAEDESLRPFDLATGPVLRCRVVRLAEDDHLFVFTFHHIVSDGWSTDLFVRELLAAYARHTGAGEEPTPTLPPLAIHYADYAAWEHAWLAGEILEGQLGYWQRHLAGAPAVIDLPTDRPRPPVARHRGGRAPIHLDAELADRLAAITREHGVTAFMFYLATFAALLHRLCGQRDVLIGTPVSGRRQTELESVLGFFANTLVMRFGFDDAPDLATLLRRSRQVVLDAHAHQDLPFERLVDEIQPERNLAHSPVFQTLFVLHQATTLTTADGTPRAHLVSVDNHTARFDLSLVLIERDEGFSGFLEFDTDLFDASTAERFVGFYLRLLDGFAHQPDRPIDRLPMLDAAERARLVRIPEPVAFVDADSTVPARFEQCAAEHPDRIALRFEGASMSYAELARRSGRLARHLRTLGVREDVLVGVAMERSFELVVALLAIQRAGGAYVP